MQVFAPNACRHSMVTDVTSTKNGRQDEYGQKKNCRENSLRFANTNLQINESLKRSLITLSETARDYWRNC